MEKKVDQLHSERGAGKRAERAKYAGITERLEWTLSGK